MDVRKYYEAYDDRYCQVHETNLQWASDAPSSIISQVMAQWEIPVHSEILELGCGEGRDAAYLLNRGYGVMATDISPEAVRYCRKKYPRFADYFRVLDCVSGRIESKFDFIYAIAVIHMLVEDPDRQCFYRFFRDHLKENGIALICSMGDGTMERSSDISTAFDLQLRTHGQTGKQMQLAGTSCRMVNWESFLREIRENDLNVMEYGLTAVEPDFPVMMYAVVKKS